MEFLMRPIGEIHTPFLEKRDTPIQPSHSTARGQVEVYPAYVDGLRVTPFLDDQERGLFATRYPARPNPVGLSIVRLLAIHDHVLEIEGADMLDGTPLLDLKPYVPDFDVRTDVRTGWYTTKSRSAR